MDTYYTLTYQPSSTYFFQGTQHQLRDRMRRTGEKIVGGSNGSWHLSKPAIRIINEYVEGNLSRRAYPDKFLRNVRGVKRITINSCQKLVDDLNKGIVSFSQLL